MKKIGRRHRPSMDITPILDGLVSVIFFLLLSTTFVQFSKLTLPPAQVASSSQSEKLPLSPKIILTESSQLAYINLIWSGDKPGRLSKNQVPIGEVKQTATEMIEQFKANFPEEKAIEVGMSRGSSYQFLISMLDGIREGINDVALISYNEVDIRTREIRSGMYR